jgi:ligand-binding sensor domain-containing protein
MLPLAKRNAIAFAFALLTLAGAEICAQEYSFRSLGIAEGLSNLAVRRIYQDSVGFLWVSTENGIFRFDGDRFEAFSAEQGIPLNSGVAFGDAPDGSLLVGGGIGLYRLSGNRFEKLQLGFNTIGWAQGIQSDGKGHTFLGTDIGLVELSAQPGQPQFALNPPEHPDPEPMAFSWMATFSGMAAASNSAASMLTVHASLDEKSACPTMNYK